VVFRLKRSSGIEDDEDYDELKQFDVQSGRGSAADHQRGTISVAGAADVWQSQQRKQKRSSHGATVGVGHDGPQEATPRDETRSAASQ